MAMTETVFGTYRVDPHTLATLGKVGWLAQLGRWAQLRVASAAVPGFCHLAAARCFLSCSPCLAFHPLRAHASTHPTGGVPGRLDPG